MTTCNLREPLGNRLNPLIYIDSSQKLDDFGMNLVKNLRKYFRRRFWELPLKGGKYYEKVFNLLVDWIFAGDLQ